MAGAATRELVDRFYDAYLTGNRDKLAALLHDDVEWLISGPVAILGFSGTRHGKAQVLELSTKILPDVLTTMEVKRESLVIDGDRVATLNRLSARCRQNGRPIGYRFAHFLRFKDDKVIKNLSIIDTFDASEQMLGHTLSVHEDAKSKDAVEDLVFV